MSADTAPLRAVVAGDVVAPGDAAWDVARQPWNLAADQRPDLVVEAASAADVAETVRFAAAHDLRVAVQSTGHGAVALGDLAGTILLRTGRLAAVEVDADARVARIAAGARWGDVVPLAAEHGLAAPHGSSPTVGVAGYTLGGGIGWYARSHGFCANLVRAFDVVTASGETRRVDAAGDPDLFWALRGGGGAGVAVTAIELSLLPVTEAYAGSLLWPIAQAREVAHAYREWAAGLPDTVTSTLKLVRYPPLPEVPEPIRGQAFANVTLASTAGTAETEALVAPLRAGAPPVLDTLAVLPAAGLATVAGDPPGPLPGIGDGLLLSALTPEVVDAFVDLAGPDADVPLIHLEIRALGGALARGGAGDGAASESAAAGAAALVYGVGLPMTPAVGAAIGATLDAVIARLSPWAAGTALTFAERQPGLRASFAPAAADRLAAVVAATDPDGRFTANHVVD
jgi:hypothetical protein